MITITAQDQRNIDVANAVTALQTGVALRSETDWAGILQAFVNQPTTEQVQALVSLRAAMSAETDPAAKNVARAAMKSATAALAESMVA